MTDLKTTVTAFVTGVLGILAYFGIGIPETYVTPIILVGVALLGYFTSDKKKE